MSLIKGKLARGLFGAMSVLLALCMLFTGCGQKTTPPDNGEGTQNEGGAGNGGNNDDGNQNTEGTENGGEANESQGLESGFKPSNSAADAPANYCAYKSDTNEFNIDDVTLEFFFGGHYASGVEHELSHSRNYPTFELYFVDEEGNRYFVKRIEENFVSEKYSCDVVYDENWYITEIKYNHSEKITIPSEIFTKESGQIWFEIHSANANDIEPDMECITGISIFYQVSNGKVVLSNQ